MTYSGRVVNGRLVLDDPVPLTDGTRIEVVVLEDAEPPHEAKPPWLVAVEIGASVPAEEWEKTPADASINLDHYLYGAPKREE